MSDVTDVNGNVLGSKVVDNSPRIDYRSPEVQLPDPPTLPALTTPGPNFGSNVFAINDPLANSKTPTSIPTDANAADTGPCLTCILLSAAAIYFLFFYKGKF